MRLAEGTLLMSVSFEGQKLFASDQAVATGVSAANDHRAKNAVSLGVFDLFGSTREFCRL